MPLLADRLARGLDFEAATARTGGTEPHHTERPMAKDLKSGDKVEWNTSQGKTEGTVKRKLTSETHIKEHKVAASEDDPQFLVESDRTGAEAAHKPDALRKRS
jgi:hypothetical protein